MWLNLRMGKRVEGCLPDTFFYYLNLVLSQVEKKCLGKSQKAFLPVWLLKTVKEFTRSTWQLLCWKVCPLLPALPREQTLQQGRVFTAAKQCLRGMSSDPGTNNFSSPSLGFLNCKWRLLQHLSWRLLVSIKPAAMAESPPGIGGKTPR